MFRRHFVVPMGRFQHALVRSKLNPAVRVLNRLPVHFNDCLDRLDYLSVDGNGLNGVRIDLLGIPVPESEGGATGQATSMANSGRIRERWKRFVMRCSCFDDQRPPIVPLVGVRCAPTVFGDRINQ